LYFIAFFYEVVIFLASIAAKILERIVLLSPAHPLRGGIASSTERLALELQDQGYQVTVYSFSLQYPSFLFPGKTQYADGPAPEGIEIITCVNSINPFNWIKIGRRLRKQAPNLIIARFWLPFIGPSMGTILRIAKGNGITKTLAITDNVIPHERRIGDRPLTAYFIKAVDAFVVMSRSVMDDIRSFNSDKPVSYIPHPIYDNYGQMVSKAEAIEHLDLESDQSYLLFFGFIRPYKGLDLLLQAMADERIKKIGAKSLSLPVNFMVPRNLTPKSLKKKAWRIELFYEQIISQMKIFGTTLQQPTSLSNHTNQLLKAVFRS
jgi:D-inositol-3-phosphate glycosyltransferase